jgi:hypothetical protein
MKVSHTRLGFLKRCVSQLLIYENNDKLQTFFKVVSRIVWLLFGGPPPAPPPDVLYTDLPHA